MVPRNSRTIDNPEDINRLLEIATRPKPVKQIDSEVLSFITEKKIEVGKKKVPTYVIYYLYTQWQQGKRKSRESFFKNFILKFQRVRLHDGYGYLLNPKPFDLGPTAYFKARALKRKEYNERQKPKK